MKFILLILSLFLFVGCADLQVENEKSELNEVEEEVEEEVVEEVYYIEIESSLIEVEADPDKGFFWDYFLYVPHLYIPEDDYLHLMVTPNNTGFPDDDLEVHKEAAYLEAATTDRFFNVVATRLEVPLLVPTFPRPGKEWWIYTQSLDRETMLVESGPLQRIDLQLIAMIKDAQNQLELMGLNMEEQILMNGFSASGVFSNRFAILHPHIVKAVATGGINSIPILPISELDGEKLNYPIGVADIEEFTGEEFNYNEYIKIPQYIYMGEKDDNDTTEYRSAFSQKEAEQIWRLIGKDMDVRWENSKKIYEEQGTSAQLVTFKGRGHEIDIEIRERVIAFFEGVIKE